MKDLSISKNSNPFSTLIFNTFNELPVESIAFAVASLALHFFNFSAASTFVGISAGLLCSKLVVKLISVYDQNLFIELTKKACKLTRRYPKLQMLSFIVASLLSTPSQKLGFFAGFIVGGFNAIIMDVEKYKFIRKNKYL